jgi:hypothetical protein
VISNAAIIKPIAAILRQRTTATGLANVMIAEPFVNSHIKR